MFDNLQSFRSFDSSDLSNRAQRVQSCRRRRRRDDDDDDESKQNSVDQRATEGSGHLKEEITRRFPPRHSRQIDFDSI